MQNLKLLIFDLDGTLINAYVAIEQSFNFVMRALGLKPRGSLTIRRAVGWGDRNLLKPFLPEKDLDCALKLYRNHHKQSLIKNSRLYPKVKFLLKQIKSKKIKLAVASNRPTEFSLILLKHLDILKYFDYILCGDKLKKGKPHPEILNRIIAHFKIKKEQALYVGDMVIDAQAGRRAKVRTVIVIGGSSALSQLKKEKPAKVIGKISDLLNYIGIKALDRRLNR